jgi:RimJ/RimL family protein N-acetyltransferase
MTPPVLMTERLVLRGHEAGDLDDCAQMWSDWRVTRYIGFNRTRQDTWFTMARYRGFWPLLGYGYWIVRHRETGAFIGEAGFADFQRGLEPDISGVPEAGWALASAAFGRGYGLEAVTAMHAWLDRALPGQACHCIIDPANTASIRLAEKSRYAYASDAMSGETRVLLFRRQMPGA